MRVRWGHLCEAAEHQGAVYSVRRVFKSFTMPRFGDLRLPSPCFLAFLLEADENEGKPGQALQLQLSDAFGDRFSQPSSHTIHKWTTIGKGHPLVFGVTLRLDNWVITRPGHYHFDVRVEGDLVGAISFVVLPANGAAPGGSSRLSRHGFRLENGHLADRATIDAEGRLTVDKIFPWVYLPPSVDGAVYTGDLALMMRAGADDGPDHEMRVTVTNSAGEDIGAPYVAQVRGEPTYPDGPFTWVTIVHLEDILFPEEGDYAFRAFVDGQPTDRVSFWVMHDHGQE